MSLTEQRKQIQNLIDNTNEPTIELVFNLYWTAVIYEIEGDFVRAKFESLKETYIFIKWLTEYAHIAPE